MKKTIIIAIAVIAIITTAIAENAIYIYRNDGCFNAFLDSRIDSIKYSYTTTVNGIKEEKFDKQIIYTPDGNYDIPLSAIDSVVFTERPAPELKDDLFHLTVEHLPYIIKADSLTLIFSSDIPYNLIPRQNCIIVSDVYEEPLANGFYGKALTIVPTEDNIIVYCSEVALNEMFENMVCVGTIVSDNKKHSISTYSTNNSNNTFELNSFTQSLGDVIITDNPSVIIDYCFNVENGDDIIYTLNMKQTHEFDIKMNYTANQDSIIAPVWVDTVLVQFPYGQTAKLAVGSYLESTGIMKFENFETKKVISGKYDISNNSTGLNGPTYSESNANGYMELNGDIVIGGLFNVMLPFSSSDSIYYRTGIALSADFGITDNTAVYSQLQNANLRNGGHIKKEWWVNGESFPTGTTGYRQDYLVPSFQTPTYTICDSGSSVNIECVIEKYDLFMPAKIGIGLIDNLTGLNIDTIWYDNEYLDYSDFPDNKLSVTFENLNAGRSYTSFPVVNVMGITMRATPETSFTILESVTSGLEIDLGLSVNWAGWNLGASSPEERGNFYAWGETSTKSQFDTSTYQYYSSSSINIGNDISSTRYDAPYNNWGGGWRMPTTEEFNELLNCVWTETTLDGIQGYKVTGPNGNSIFLPNTGYKQGSQNTTSSNGYYWTSNGMTTMSYAYCLSTANGFEGIILKERYWGLVIRPVKSK